MLEEALEHLVKGIVDHKDDVVVRRKELRRGEVLEVRGPHGEPPYLVRWADGHECLMFPGPDAHVDHAHVDQAPG